MREYGHVMGIQVQTRRGLTRIMVSPRTVRPHWLVRPPHALSPHRIHHELI
jgi:hypothetical protein